MSYVISIDFLVSVLVVIAVGGIVYTTIGLSMGNRKLKVRVKALASERETLSRRRLSELQNAQAEARGIVREKQIKWLEQIVNLLNLRKLFADDDTAQLVRVAGLRGTTPLYFYLFARLCLPVVMAIVASFYLFVLDAIEMADMMKLIICAAAGALGFFLPNIYIKNRISKRQAELRQAWPDALDVLLIGVESGTSIELALKRVAMEIGTQCRDLAEELLLTIAELNYLDNRSTAFENLAKRTGLESIKNTVMALNQAERYGTPVGQALRIMAEENRVQRMQEAEKLAASLPPKLTVPMIVFFLPVIFVVILTPVILSALSNT